MIGFLALLGYVASIFGANWAITTIGLIPVGFGLLAPAGVAFAGLTLSLRDLVQRRMGGLWTLVAIVVGGALSALLSPQLALASSLAFLASELADMAVWTPLSTRSIPLALAASNTVGLVLDSALFLALAFGSLDFLAGQVVGKAYVTLLALAVLLVWRRAVSDRRWFV